MRVSPAGARFAPFTSTHVLGAITGTSPSALATSVIAGAGAVLPEPIVAYACATFVPVAVSCQVLPPSDSRLPLSKYPRAIPWVWANEVMLLWYGSLSLHPPHSVMAAACRSGERR